MKQLTVTIIIVMAALVTFSAAAQQTRQHQTWGGFQRSFYATCTATRKNAASGAPEALINNACACIADATIGHEAALRVFAASDDPKLVARALKPDTQRCTQEATVAYARTHPGWLQRYVNAHHARGPHSRAPDGTLPQTRPARAAKPSKPSPAYQYLRAVVNAAVACERAGGSAVSCFVDASPARCETTTIDYVANPSAHRRAWAMCVESCADANWISRHFGSCARSND